MGGASTTMSPSFLPSRAPEAMPQMTLTTSIYRTTNFTPAAVTSATGCRQTGLWVLPAINCSSTTKHTLPNIMGKTVTKLGAIPNRYAHTGLISAMVIPLLMPTSSTAIASTAFTQEPVTNCPIGLVSACKVTSNASMTAVSVIHKIFLRIMIPLSFV